MNKKCSKCKQEFEMTQKNQWYCKPCMALRKKEEYHRNKDKYVARYKGYRLAARQFKYDYLKSHPCEQCGESRPEALDFDHIDRSKKTLIFAEASRYTVERLQEELKNCRVLCANCHRVHTAEQLGWYKDLH